MLHTAPDGLAAMETDGIVAVTSNPLNNANGSSLMAGGSVLKMRTAYPVPRAVPGGMVEYMLPPPVPGEIPMLVGVEKFPLTSLNSTLNTLLGLNVPETE